jgi:bifunctional UDP-N-acetylglucosamine pyrophosphorylase/glucosamine-1-phosphate N-acetyltransferase
MGVNDRLQLSHVEGILRQRIREQWMLSGVTMPDPASVYIDAGASIGQDTVILPNTSIVGSSVIGEDCEIGPNSVISDSTLGRGCRATASVLEEATMEDGANIGPFSHLRPGAYLESGVHLGNFVEVKESRFAAGSVMGHFGYIGDASIGAGTNLGAGMVTCNYDGKDKHRTNIGENAFIGCDTMLVAPVTVGAGATTGAGSVVTKNVPPGRLAVGVPARIINSEPETN